MCYKLNKIWCGSSKIRIWVKNKNGMDKKKLLRANQNAIYAKKIKATGQIKYGYEPNKIRYGLNEIYYGLNKKWALAK